MRIRHFYHVYAAGAWFGPVQEHITALSHAGFRSPVTAGLVGPAGSRNLVREWITTWLAREGLPAPDTWTEADEGYEQVTLTALRDYACSCIAEEAILYAHTKGAWHSNPLNECWRRSMTRHVVGQWQRCARLVTSGSYDTAGCHWLTPEAYSGRADYAVTVPVYAGNFWWARAGYLRTLPPLQHDHRHRAEEWIGLGSPEAFDLLPGWPSMELCASQETKEAEARRARQVRDRVPWFRGAAAEFNCAHADETCRGPMCWVSISRGYRDVGDFMPLCRSHQDRHENPGLVTA